MISKIRDTKKSQQMKTLVKIKNWSGEKRHCQSNQWKQSPRFSINQRRNNLFCTVDTSRFKVRVKTLQVLNSFVIRIALKNDMRCKSSFLQCKHFRDKKYRHLDYFAFSVISIIIIFNVRRKIINRQSPLGR